MKVIDQTPYLNDKGEIGLLDQAKAAVKFGPSWWPEVQAQKLVMDQLNRGLERGYTLFRNYTLPGTQAQIPLILVGATGLYVLYASQLAGMYHARGDQWGVMEKGSFRIAPVNLLTRTARLARAVQVFLRRQGLEAPSEGILLLTSPAMHVESVRPIVRIVLSDALERFVSAFAQARTTFATETVQEIVNRLQHALPARNASPLPQPPPEPEPVAPVMDAYQPEPQPEDAPHASSLGFSFDETASEPQEAGAFTVVPSDYQAGTQPVPLPARRTGGKRFSRKQWALLAFFGIFEVVILLVFAYLVLTNL